MATANPSLAGAPSPAAAREPQPPFDPNASRGIREAVWIGGWAVNPDRLRPCAAAFPEAHHRFLAPVLGAAESAAKSDLVIGWSLGAWRILEAASRGVHFSGKVLLLAPFVAFCSDYGLGGRCAVTQVLWLRRWLQRDPMGALADFHQRAGLGIPSETPPYALEDMLEGLDRLAEDAPGTLRTFAAQGLPPNWQAIVGSADPLVDALKVQLSLPGCRLAPGAGHAAEDLLAALEMRPDAV